MCVCVCVCVSHRVDGLGGSLLHTMFEMRHHFDAAARTVAHFLVEHDGDLSETLDEVVAVQHKASLVPPRVRICLDYQKSCWAIGVCVRSQSHFLSKQSTVELQCSTVQS